MPSDAAYLQTQLDLAHSDLKSKEKQLRSLRQEKEHLLQELEKALLLVEDKDGQIRHLETAMELPTMSTQRFGEGHTEMHLSQYPLLEMEWVKPLILGDGTDRGDGKFIIWRPSRKLKVKEAPGFVPLIVSYCEVTPQGSFDHREVHHKVLYQVGTSEHSDSRWRKHVGSVTSSEEPWKQIPEALEATDQISKSLEAFIGEASYLSSEITRFKFSGTSLRPFISEYIDRHVCQHLKPKGKDQAVKGGSSGTRGSMTTGKTVYVPVVEKKIPKMMFDVESQTKLSGEDVDKPPDVIEIEVPVEVEKIVYVEREPETSFEEEEEEAAASPDKPPSPKKANRWGKIRVATKFGAGRKKKAEESLEADGEPHQKPTRSAREEALDAAARKALNSEELLGSIVMPRDGLLQDQRDRALYWMLAKKKDAEAQTDHYLAPVRIREVEVEKPVTVHVPVHKVVERYIKVPSAPNTPNPLVWSGSDYRSDRDAPSASRQARGDWGGVGGDHRSDGRSPYASDHRSERGAYASDYRSEGGAYASDYRSERGAQAGAQNSAGDHAYAYASPVRPLSYKGGARGS